MGFRPTRWRFDALRVFVRRATTAAEAALWPPLRFRAPSETTHSSPAPQRRSTDPKVGRHVPRCCLSWGFVPYDTFQAGGSA
jgi:hypothetical protein